MLTACLASCKKDNADVNQTDSESESESEEQVVGPVVLDLIKDGATEYKIIYPENASEELQGATNTLRNAILNKYGVVLKMTDDTDEIDPDACEILVGRTNREESAKALSGIVGNMDYFAGVVGNKLVFSGKDDGTVMNAVLYFVNHVLNKVSEEDLAAKNLSFSSEQNYLYNATYPFPDLKLLGEDITDYKIVVPAASEVKYEVLASELSYYINNMTGRPLSVIKDTEASGSKELWIGKLPDSTTVLKEHEYAITVKGDCLELAAESLSAMMEMLSESQKLFTGGTLSDAAKKDSGEIIRQDVSTLDKNVGKAAFNKLGEFRIMYHNVWGWYDGNNRSQPVSQRMEILYDTYMEYAPDVLCLQEVTGLIRADKDFSLIEKLCQSGYAEVEVDPVDGLLTATPILYRTDAFKLIAKGVHKFTGNGSGSDKFITWAVLEALDANGQGTGETVAVMSIHLAYQEGNVGDNYREDQIKNIVSPLAKELAGRYVCPVIIGGDMNCTIGKKAFKLYAENGIKDVFDVLSEDKRDDYKSYYAHPKLNADTALFEKTAKTPGGKYEYAIDHVVYLGEGLDFGCFTILAEDYAMRGADHAPLLVDFDLSSIIEDYTEADHTKNY